MSAPDIQAALEAVEKIKTLINSKRDMELMDKIILTTSLKTIQTHLESATAAPVDTEDSVAAADVNAPVATNTLGNKQTAQEVSNRLSHGFSLWKQIRENLTDGIRSNDKRITNISAPARVNETMKNTFDNTEGIALMVISTSTDAYMLVKDNQGLYKMSSARYWKSNISVAGK